MACQDRPLRRELSFFSVMITSIGMIIGAGIFAVLGTVAGEAGNAAWLAFTIAGFAAALTALSYAEFASMFPRAGAEFDYITAAFGKKAGFIAGLVIVISCIIGGAMVMTSCAGYAASILCIHPAIIAFLLVVPFLFFLLRGVKDLARFVILFTVCEAGCLVLLFAISVPYTGTQDYLAMPHGFAGLMSASAMAFVAYAGFESIVKLAGETREPETVIPRALLIALAAVTALYALAAFGSASVAGWQALAGSATPVSLVFGQVLHSSSAQLVSAVIVAGTANTAVMVLFAASRVLYGMASSGVLPASLAKLSPEWQVPSTAVIVAVLGTLPFLALGNVGFLASLASFLFLAVYIIINAGIISLRITDPQRLRPFRIPFAAGRVPLTAFLGMLVSAALLLMLPAQVLAAGSASILVIGLAAWYAGRCGYLDRCP